MSVYSSSKEEFLIDVHLKLEKKLRVFEKKVLVSSHKHLCAHIQKYRTQMGNKHLLHQLCRKEDVVEFIRGTRKTAKKMEGQQ